MVVGQVQSLRLIGGSLIRWERRAALHRNHSIGSPVTAFPDAVAESAQNVLGPIYSHPEPREYINDADRRVEAQAIERCVERFIDYETGPPSHGRGVGRYAPGSLTPPIGQLIGPQGSWPSPEEREQLRSALRDAVAVGYVAQAGLESDGEGFSPSADVDPQKIWRLWVVRLHSETLNDVGIPKEFQNNIRHLASDRFTADLKTIGVLPRVRKRMRYGLVGQWYGQAGMLLRLIQATEDKWDLSEDLFQITNTWPFDP